MSLTDQLADDVFRGSSYDIIPWFHRQELLYFREFGSYQGDWLIVSYDHRKNEYLLWEGGYGSCSGCDAFQDTFEYAFEGPVVRSHEKVIAFMADYKPFLEIPADTMRNVVRTNNLRTLFPKNAYRDYNDEPEDGIGDACDVVTLICKLNEGVDVAAEDIFNCDNAEVRRRATERYGEEKWLEDMQATIVHRDECGVLYQIRDRRYVLVQDASTPRRFLLRVPSEDTRLRARGQRSTQPLDTARGAVAWTFNMSPDEYQPESQT